MDTFRALAELGLVLFLGASVPVAYWLGTIEGRVRQSGGWERLTKW